MNPTELTWIRLCSSSACAEIAYEPEKVHLRSSERPEETITYSRQEWRDLVDAIHSGAVA